MGCCGILSLLQVTSLRRHQWWHCLFCLSNHTLHTLPRESICRACFILNVSKQSANTDELTFSNSCKQSKHHSFLLRASAIPQATACRGGILALFSYFASFFHLCLPSYSSLSNQRQKTQSVSILQTSTPDRHVHICKPSWYKDQARWSKHLTFDEYFFCLLLFRDSLLKTSNVKKNNFGKSTRCHTGQVDETSASRPIRHPSCVSKEIEANTNKYLGVIIVLCLKQLI